jgi:PD-(D/E)XK endonuclease
MGLDGAHASPARRDARHRPFGDSRPGIRQGGRCDGWTLKLAVVDATHRLKAPEPSSHPVDVGLRTEAAILAELVRRGYQVLVPFGTNQRYDLVLDVSGRFVRAQCKTGRLREGVVRFSTRSIRSNTRETFFRDYAGEVELFLVYCPETNGIYAVPVDEAPSGYGYLRVEPTRNGQAEGIRWARDYELPA